MSKQLPFTTQAKTWMGSQTSPESAEWWMVGLPYDGTTTYRPGTRFGPEAIRAASWGLETYSPKQHKTLESITYWDAGELELPCGNRDASLACIKQAAQAVFSAGKKYLGIGGEHLVTLPAVEAALERYPDLAVLHFDAHADLRDDYMGERLSHATVLRRVADLIGPERLVQIGIRSGPPEEFAWMRQHQTLMHDLGDLPKALARLANRPVFLTLDLDVLDPSILPGTGTPEPGGLSFAQLHEWLLAFSSLNVVAADVLELSPHYDPSGVSAVVAAKVIREILLLNAPSMA
jgi:agmatinase